MDEQVEKVGSTDEPKKKGEGFFTLNLFQVVKMVRQGAGAEEVMAYLVMARGTGRQGFSTHGANSIAHRVGLTHYRSEIALGGLAEQGFIKKPVSGDETIKMRQARWLLTESLDVKNVALPNSLLDGNGKSKDNPPLTRIYNEVNMGNHCVVADARLDALMVLLHLYLHHLLADFGGVNPRSGMYRKWQAAENNCGNKVEEIEGTIFSLYEIEGGNETVFLKFAAEALFYIEDAEERIIRFWDAFNNLQRLGFIYEVIQVWSGNPVEEKLAQPLYTLYVCDRHARVQDPFLQTAIHRLVLRRRHMDPYIEFPHIANDYEPTENNIIGTGRFRYIANKKTGGFPIGIFRLRCRAHTKDTGKGIAAELRRVTDWANLLDEM